MGWVIEVTGKFKFSCFDILLHQSIHTRSLILVLFFSSRKLLNHIFCSSWSLWMKEGKQSKGGSLALILEKHLKAWLNINTYLRHICYRVLIFILETDCDFLKKVPSQNRNLHRWLLQIKVFFSGLMHCWFTASCTAQHKAVMLWAFKSVSPGVIIADTAWQEGIWASRDIKSFSVVQMGFSSFWRPPKEAASPK